MRTPFENLKDGSRFKPFNISNEGNYTKVDDIHYTFNNGGPEPFNNPKRLVYPLHPYSLKDSGEIEQWTIKLGFLDVCKLLLIGCIIIMVLSAVFSSHDKATPEQAVQAPAAETTDIKQSDTAITSSAASITRSSNGYDWKRADPQTRKRFCQTIATAESKEFSHDFTADFYYDALDSFYNSSDRNILSENIEKVVGLTTSAAIAGQ